MTAKQKLELYLKARHPEGLKKEWRFHPTRRWRFDYAWPCLKIAIEYEGGTWTGGGHVRGKIYSQNCEKYNHAVLLGWQVYRFTPDMIRQTGIWDFIDGIFELEEGNQ